ALVHGGDGVLLAEIAAPDLALLEEARDHADDAPARRQRRVGHGAHDPDIAAAIDEGDAARRQAAPERFRRRPEFGAAAEARAGIDANAGDASPGHGRSNRSPERARA